ncbi:hypothetical protein M501DRAFT_998788 [Patellaria atrata CBS 101060]|uniref:Uncharacterized protein n=1 Tax=Patellaria atrata CBS 101060 TaxID=1346257 RepID=A0A9P4VSW8_9PEZI|nr:hypothetical protein M501DRAFT_998788 [Patellaria atrata CBS 101060]
MSRLRKPLLRRTFLSNFFKLDRDADGDSTMHSSPSGSPSPERMDPGAESSNAEESPTTPTQSQTMRSPELSPPNSQGPSTTTGRLDAFFKGFITSHKPAASSVKGKSDGGVQANGIGTISTDPETGYTWDTPETAPGAAWRFKKTREDAARAWEQVIEKHAMILNRYGDPFDDSVPVNRRVS